MRRFCFRLALALGRDVREIFEWPSSLISEWLAYDQLDPIPDSNWQTGLLASIMANAWGSKKTRPEDWIPRVKTRRRQSMAEQRSILLGAAIAAEARKGRV